MDEKNPIKVTFTYEDGTTEDFESMVGMVFFKSGNKTFVFKVSVSNLALASKALSYIADREIESEYKR